MLVAGVVDHEVHHDLDAPLVRLGNEQIELRQVAENGLDLPVVADVVAVVVLRRRVHGGEPEGIHPELGKIIQSAADAAEVADPVAV